MSGSMLRLAGGAAVLGGVANLVADFLLRGGPSSVAASEITLEALANVPFDSVYAGSWLGAAAIPLWLCGLWPVYRALEPAGPRLALAIVVSFGYGIVVASGYHGIYVFFAGGYQALAAAGPESAAVLTEMMGRFQAYHDALMMVFVVPWVVASIGFVLTVLFLPTRYARWMALLSPILVPITMPIVSALPSPFGGWIRPIAGTTIWTSFFLMSTWVVWRLDSQEPQGGLL